MTDLYELARPFPDKFVHTNPSGGGSYVKHHVVNQRLLTVVGPFDFALVQILRGHVAGKAPNPKGDSQRARDGVPALDDAVVGAVCRLTCTIDGRLVTVEEVGDCESPHNWPHDGARMKDAMSDALKRCAMRIGLGIHLWSQDEYYLDKQLAKQERETDADDRKEDPPAASQATPDAAAKPASTDRQAGADPSPPAVIGANERKRIMALCGERGISTADADRDERLNRLGQLIGRVPLKSVNDIRADEYEPLIAALKELPKVARQPELAS